MHDRRARTFYRFALSAEHYARRLAAMYRPAYGISPPEWKMLAILAQHAPMSATAAAERTSLMPDKVTRAVDGLVEKKLVVRRRDREDERRVVLSLTAKGARAFAEIDAVRYEIESEMLAGLSAEENRALHRALEKIESRLGSLKVVDGAAEVLEK
jgi:DNA-binding MarR family transcriptional regulator